MCFFYLAEGSTQLGTDWVIQVELETTCSILRHSVLSTESFAVMSGGMGRAPWSLYCCAALSSETVCNPNLADFPQSSPTLENTALDNGEAEPHATKVLMRWRSIALAICSWWLRRDGKVWFNCCPSAPILYTQALDKPKRIGEILDNWDQHRWLLETSNRELLQMRFIYNRGMISRQLFFFEGLLLITLRSLDVSRPTQWTTEILTSRYTFNESGLGSHAF